ncbi:hypothetical protein BGZ92_000899 [Podila epicladia]|nr:hypothetical protein BGZ92_000899 [Podila epicladia]
MSSNESTSSSTNPLFEEQTDFLLQRHTLPFEKLLESFNKRYSFETSGSLSDALIKGARRILNRGLDADIKSWAEDVIKKTKCSWQQREISAPDSAPFYVNCLFQADIAVLEVHNDTQQKKLGGTSVYRTGERGAGIWTSA